MLSVMGAFAEFERALSKERRREGVALAKARGAYKGRKKVLSKERAEALKKRVSDGLETKAQIAREFGITRETLYQYLRENSGLAGPVMRGNKAELIQITPRNFSSFCETNR